MKLGKAAYMGIWQHFIPHFQEMTFIMLLGSMFEQIDMNKIVFNDNIKNSSWNLKFNRKKQRQLIQKKMMQ